MQELLKVAERNISWNTGLNFRSNLAYVFRELIIYGLDDNVKLYVAIALKMKDCICLSIELKQPVIFSKNKWLAFTYLKAFVKKSYTSLKIKVFLHYNISYGHGLCSKLVIL